MASKLAGRFIVIDGPDGAGKGTQIAALVEHLHSTGGSVESVRDPGGTPAGDLIRRILLAPNGVDLDVATETLLFMASRAQLVAEKVRPALKSGAAVICDRFISATCAYQGAAGADIDAIIRLGRFAVGDTWPDLTVVLDVPAEEGLRRIGILKHNEQTGRWSRIRKPRKRAGRQAALFHDVQPETPDSMEARSLAFHRRVCEIFRSLPGVYPRPVEVIDATADPETVHARILEVLARVDL